MPRTPLPLALACALSLALAGCGHAPTSPASSASRQGLSSYVGIDDVDAEVVVTLADEVSAYYIASDYEARLIEWDYAAHCAKFVPRPGQPREKLAELLAEDARCVTVDLNTYLEDVETRQQSFAFDDGIPGEAAYLEQAAAKALHLEAAHFVTKGRGVRVAVIDNGIDASHPSLAGRILMGRDFVADDDDPSDTPDGIDQDGDGFVDEAFGHGTHVAGLVALTAPEASLLIARVLDSDGRGDVLDVASGIRWAIRSGARVINLSLGTLDEVAAIQKALQDAEALGIVVIASAGNRGSALPEEFPARSNHANAVAATDAQARPAPFTSYAKWVAISAPGVGVRSAYPGGGFRLWSGTSMSAPFVAGAAALVLERHPDWSPDRVMGRLRWTTRPIQGALPQQQGMLGRGMLDVLAAVRADHVHVPPGGGDPPVDGAE